VLHKEDADCIKQCMTLKIEGTGQQKGLVTMCYVLAEIS